MTAGGWRARSAAAALALSLLAPMPTRAALPVEGGEEGLRVIPLDRIGLDDWTRRAFRGRTLALEVRLRADRVALDARLRLRRAAAPDGAAGPLVSSLLVRVNGEEIARLALAGWEPGTTRELPIDARLLLPTTQVELVVAPPAPTQEGCLARGAWQFLDGSATIEVREAGLPALRTLDDLPLPFFDPAATLDGEPVDVAVAFARPPTPAAVRAAFLLLQRLALGATRTRTPSLRARVAVGALGPVTALVVSRGADLPALGLPARDGAGVALVDHPTAAGHAVLVAWAGDDEATARTVASLPPPRASDGQEGDLVRVTPGARVRLDEALKGEPPIINGRQGGVLRVPFSIPPAVSFWPDEGLAVTMVVAQELGPGERGSRLVAALDGRYLATLANAGGTRSIRREVQLTLPQPLLGGRGELQIYSEFEGDACPSPQAPVSTRIDGATRFDARHALTYAALPDLARYAREGTPLLLVPQGARAAFVLPDPAPPGAVAAALALGVHLTRLLGEPLPRVRFVSPGQVDEVADRDLVVVGAALRGGGAAVDPRLLASRPAAVGAHGELALAEDQLERGEPAGEASLAGLADALQRVAMPSPPPSPPTAAMRARAVTVLAYPSPLRAGRLVMEVTAPTDEALAAGARWLPGQPTGSAVGALLLVDGRTFEVEAERSSGVGHAGLWPRLLRRLAQHPLSLLLPAGVVASLALALLIRAAAGVQHRRRLAAGDDA